MSIDVTMAHGCRIGLFHRHRHSAANGPTTMVAMAPAGGDGARYHMGAGWTRSVHSCSPRSRPHPYHYVTSDGIRSRACRVGVPGRLGARGRRVLIPHRSAGEEEMVHDYAPARSDSHSPDCAVLGPVEFHV